MMPFQFQLWVKYGMGQWVMAGFFITQTEAEGELKRLKEQPDVRVGISDNRITSVKVCLRAHDEGC